MRTPAGEAFSRLAVALFRLDGALTAAGDALARPAGQTTARWRVLAAVEDEPHTVAQIARAWSFARQSVQRIADALEEEGLVTYEDNPGHRRAKLVTLTRAGRRALAQIQTAQQAWANDVGAKIGAADLDAATEILGRVLAALSC
ncbi:MAG TPA: MarR family transcriptional regulator [Gaiellaceae bacterium]|nr:MarR family transcriptional regulator [Gaiellaceae bacterium]